MRWPEAWPALTDRLEGVGLWLAPLGLRLVLAWEFFEAGREKFSGSNWFMDIHGDFPFPFSALPAGLSWSLATWAELLLSLALLLGLGTRFAAFGLFVLTVVATAAVHWPGDWMVLGELAAGYSVSDTGHGNYKLPLLFMVMLLPLLFFGGGKLSLDALLAWRMGLGPAQPWADFHAWGLSLLALGLPLAMLLPVAGLVFASLGALLLALGRWIRT